MDMKMFCYQCQEASKGTGCTIKGVCGKAPEESNLMDLLIYVIKGISIYAQSARHHQVDYDREKVDKFVLKGLFSTVTNVNFDRQIGRAHV